MIITNLKLQKRQMLAFVFGLGATFTVRIIGIFALSDFIAIAFFPLLISKKDLFIDKNFRKVIVLLLLWMLATPISDIYNQTSWIDSLKGFFSLVPFLACLIFTYWLLNKDFRLINPFLWGYSISFVLSAGLGLDTFYQEMLSRKELTSVTQLGHYGKILTWILSSFITGAFSFTYFKRFPRLVILVIFIFSIFSLIEGTRSIFLINLIVAVSLLVFFNYSRKFDWDGKMLQDFVKRKIVRFSLILFLMLFTVKFIYEFSAQKGYLGEAELHKMEIQKSSKIGVLSGRGEFIAAAMAIKDEPLLGHGSFAKDKVGYGYKAALLASFSEEVVVDIERKGETNYIPAHSHLLQAWVYNGILGGIFWIFILYLLFKFLINNAFLFPFYMAYILASLFSIIWSIIFSPFSNKPFLAASITFFLVLMKEGDLLKYDY
jgi:O-antigen ligase